MSEIVSYNPATGAELGRVPLASSEDYEVIVSRASETFAISSPDFLIDDLRELVGLVRVGQVFNLRADF